MRARPHETHPACIFFSDLQPVSQDHPPEDQVSPTIDYLLDRGLRGDRRAQVLRHKIKVCLDHLKQACSPGNKAADAAIAGTFDDI